MVSGIYCIENSINGKKYIGQAINLEKRKKEHFRALKRNSHENNHLQNAYNKYGKEHFIFKPFIYCEAFELTKYEQFFVNTYTPENLYNICLECVTSSLGTKHSEESRKKISKNHADVSGIKNPNFGKYKEENPIYGILRSNETRKRMSESLKGRTFSENHRKNISDSRAGIKLSEGHRMKISKANSGENNSRAKLSEYHVLEILRLYYIEKETQNTISKKFNIGRTQVSNITIGKCWKHTYESFKTHMG